MSKQNLKRAACLAALFAVSVAASGCVRAKAYQREFLAKRGMTQDQDASEVRFQQHARGSREGSDGGTGEAGGGCGCN